MTKLQPILLSSRFGQNKTKELHLVSSETCEHMSSYTCEHELPTRASTCFLHVRARYLFVRARLLFKNVRPGQLKTFQTKIYRHWMQLGAQLCWRWIGWTILFYNDCWRTSRPVHKCQTNLNCLFLALITFCKNQIVRKNLSIVAQWWTLCESHLLRLYFGVFQPCFRSLYVTNIHHVTYIWYI